MYPQYSPAEQAEHIQAKRKYGAGLYGPFYLLADEIYTPPIMSKAWSILETARREAAGDSIVLARIEWLGKGLKHADLLLATARAYERGVDGGDQTEFLAARQALMEFRKENADYDKENFAGLGGTETKWDGRKR